MAVGTGWRRIVPATAALVLALGVWATPAGRDIEAWSHDWLARTAPLALPDPNVVVAAIDEPSFAEIGRPWPWPRSLHGALVTALREAGAAAVVLDIVMPEPSDPAEDAALAQAIAAAGRVVLAGETAEVEQDHVTSRITVQPLPLLLAAGGVRGDATVALDPDGMLRRLPGAADGLAATALRSAGRTVPVPPADALMRLPAPGGFPPRVSYWQALAPDRYLPEGLFRGRIALVGLDLQQAPEIRSGSPDTFLTPLTRTDGLLSSGASLQAVAIENLARRAWITPWPALAFVPTVAIAALGAVLLGRFSPARALGLATGGLLGTTLIAALGLRAGLWIAPVPGGLAALAVPVLEGARAFLLEREGRARVRAAFARFIAPAYVAQLDREPERLRLGGEHRDLTVMFCDLRGSTGLGERLADQPERFVRLINRFLTAMSDAIEAHGGTIDKFTGDGLMAFWGAPEPDPLHARHACEAALAMEAALARLNAELARDEPELGPLRIGIGINTGRAMVGNYGSPRRLAYSAIGDAVNTAARLEPLGQRFGVVTVLGAETAKAVGDTLALLELPAQAVKGKSAPIRVHALMGDASLAADPGFRAAAQTIERVHLARERGRNAEVRDLLEGLRSMPRVPPELLAELDGRRCG